MNEELKKVKLWLEGIGESPIKFSELSQDDHENPLVTDATQEAYNYDSVTKSFFPPDTHPCCRSCDALLLRNHLYLIEFKRPGKGIEIFNLHLEELSSQNLKKVLGIICKVESKLVESLYMLEKRILRPLAVDDNRFEKKAIVVYNAAEHAAQGRADAQASASNFSPEKLAMHNRFEGKDKNGKPVFFHSVQIVSNYLFTATIQRLC